MILMELMLIGDYDGSDDTYHFDAGELVNYVSE